jgi:hypothetical protein
VIFTIPIELPSLSNARMNWRRMATLKKDQRIATYLCIPRGSIPPLPLLITITRIGPRRLDDDNLAAACKYVRDEIARAVGVDDGSDQYTWRYEQRKGKYGIEVEITSR